MPAWSNVPLADADLQDDSDATYRTVVGSYFGPGNPQFGDVVAADVSPGAEVSGRVVGVRVRLRAAVTVGTNPGNPGARLQHFLGAGGVWTLYQDGLASASPTWLTFDFTPHLTSDDMQVLATNPSAWRASAIPAGYPDASVPSETQEWQIFEMRLEAGTATVAPPCRLFPRADGLGVGGGRHFPPPKSQQRSGRRFGYY